MAGHDHHYEIKKIESYGTLIKSGTDFRQLTDENIIFNDDGSIEVTTKRYDVTAKVEPDEKTGKIVDSYFKVLEKKMKKIVGEVNIDLNVGSQNMHRRNKCWKLICDIVKRGNKGGYNYDQFRDLASRLYCTRWPVYDQRSYISFTYARSVSNN